LDHARGGVRLNRLPQRPPAPELVVEGTLDVRSLGQRPKPDAAVVRRDDDVVGGEVVEGAGWIEDLLRVEIEAALVDLQPQPTP